MTIINQEKLQERANNLEARELNGLKLILVTLNTGVDPPEADLEVHFHNDNELNNINDDCTADQSKAKQIFPIFGGARIPAGQASHQLQVKSVSKLSSKILELIVSPIGDYSTYTLSINYQNIDRLFNEIEFKFRPGCFSIDCAPEWKKTPEPKPEPAIDYLAKDYDSFRHTLIVAMSQRVPGWQPSSEADLDQVLLELFSVAADELSDYQDRVMNEAYLVTARKRVSLARHARLMDYHIHQGNQASTWLAVQLKNGELDLPLPNPDPNSKPIPLIVWAGRDNLRDLSAVVFMTRTEQHMDALLNQMSLYTWDGIIPALAAGSTSADLQLTDGTIPITDHASAIKVQNLVREGKIQYLLIQEWLNPATGREAGRNLKKRQLLKLLSGPDGAEARQDPLTGAWFVRVSWEEKDKLKFNYCFIVESSRGQIENVSLFHGNLVQVYHGRPRVVVFKESGMLLTQENEFYYQRLEKTELGNQTKETWTICSLPPEPLAYKDTPTGGEIAPQSTLAVEVLVDGVSDPWDEVSSLIHSDNSSENGDHFVVETDEQGRSQLRFGNGVNGRQLPPKAEVHCSYQVGRGLDGNIGSDQLIYFQWPEIASCWNPFDVTSGKSPEPLSTIIRRVPEAYQFRQLRAVTLQDYINRAEELPEVSQAAARYAWIGSWRTVQIAIDPVGTTILSEQLRQKIARHLDAVLLIGEDLEIRPPRFVPLDIQVILCIHPQYWREDIKFLLQQEFSDGFTPDGRMAFFHPDLWTFGQELHASQIIGRIQAIEGVEHIISVKLKRWNDFRTGTEQITKLQPNEIIQVSNDPNHMERGFIKFYPRGGRQ